MAETSTWIVEKEGSVIPERRRRERKTKLIDPGIIPLPV
jgi:hypothetical protein